MFVEETACILMGSPVFYCFIIIDTLESSRTVPGRSQLQTSSVTIYICSWCDVKFVLQWRIHAPLFVAVEVVFFLSCDGDYH